jgi:hypothetical protein
VLQRAAIGISLAAFVLASSSASASASATHSQCHTARCLRGNTCGNGTTALVVTLNANYDKALKTMWRLANANASCLPGESGIGSSPKRVDTWSFVFAPHVTHRQEVDLANEFKAAHVFARVDVKRVSHG